MTTPADELESVLASARTALLRISDGDASAPLAPGKWSRKETLGHLIDSASNNHQRFVRVQAEDGAAMPGYAQDGWVRMQGYRDSPWPNLVGLWHLFNLHLVGVLRRIPKAALDHRCAIAGQEPVTLRFVAEDYVRHLKHHLAQILK